MKYLFLLLPFTLNAQIQGDNFTCNPYQDSTEWVASNIGDRKQEGRICEVCLRKETRTISWGYRADYTLSKYKELDAKFNPIKKDTFPLPGFILLPESGLMIRDPKTWQTIKTDSTFLYNETKSSFLVAGPNGKTEWRPIEKPKKKFRKPKKLHSNHKQ